MDASKPENESAKVSWENQKFWKIGNFGKFSENEKIVISAKWKNDVNRDQI